ncbi:MAG: LptE family protein [candidate division WOR-3 bacterium]
MNKLLYFIVLFLSCCGYSTRSTLPPQYKSIAIPLVGNQTVKPNLGELLTNQLIDDFTNDRTLVIVPNERANLILECRIINYERSPQSYTANQEVINYRITMSAFIDIIDKTKFSDESLYRGEVSSWITYDVSQESEDDGINKVIKKLSLEILRKVLTAW